VTERNPRVASVNPPTGEVTTAAATGDGLATVSATAGGVTATASVAVGSQSVVVDPMTDVNNRALTLTNGATAMLSESTTQTAVTPPDSTVIVAVPGERARTVTVTVTQ
jgi:hypothetical protein